MGIIIAAGLILFVGFTIASHAVYHRSDMATVVEIYFRMSGTKDIFADEEKCMEYIEQRSHVYPLYPIPEADEAMEQICKILEE